MSTKTARVGVIGGGVVGASILFHLADRHGVADAVLFERDQLASQSTSRAVGGIRYTFSNPLNIDLGIENLAFFKAFEERVGYPLEFRENGYLFVYRSPDEAARWRERHALYEARGMDARLLSPTETAELVPGLDTDAIEGALFARDCGHVDPYEVTTGYANAAIDAGATIHTGTGVHEILTDGDRVIGLETDEGTYEVDAVVNAAGPWTPTLMATVGIDLPIELLVRRIVVTNPIEGFQCPLVIDSEERFYFETEANGSILVCDTAQDIRDVPSPEAAPTRVGIDYYHSALGKLDALVADLDDLEVINDWAGIQSFTPDGHAIIGPTAVEGLYVATGFCGHGVMQSPSTGQALADLIATGETDAFDVSRLAPERFETADRIEPEALP